MKSKAGIGIFLIALIVVGSYTLLRLVPTVTQLPTETPTATIAYITYTLPPSPTIAFTQIPSSTPGPDAQVQADVHLLRLRASPGTAGEEIALLAGGDMLSLVGKTADGAWLQVIAPDNTLGWVMAQHIEVYANLANVPATGEAVDLTPTAPAPTATPTLPPPSPTPSPPQDAEAQVQAGIGALRLRAGPSTSQDVLGILTEFTVLTVIGRTDDNAWLRVVTPEGTTGWVMAQYIDVWIDLETVPKIDDMADLPPPEMPAAATRPTSAAPSATPIPTQTSAGEAAPPTATTIPTSTALQPTDVPITVTPPPVPTEPPVTPPPQQLPISSAISGMSGNAQSIFQKGQTMGNRANVFAKVGDSLSAMDHFLRQIGWGNYNLYEYGALQGAINAFTSDSFTRTSFAAQGGWTAGDIVNPASASSTCQPGEMPLVCEYRITKPAVALIMVGTNDAGFVPVTQYEANLRTIVQTTIDMGVVPVLSTLPPQANAAANNRINAYNQRIKSIARGYGVPLIDYWSIMVQLPNQGLGPDGVHPSVPSDYNGTAHFSQENLQTGTVVRNLLTLQMLDALRRSALH